MGGYILQRRGFHFALLTFNLRVFECQDFLLGAEGCPDLHRNDDSNIMPRENVNGGK